MYKIADSLKERVRKKERSDFIFLIVVLFVALIMSVVIFLNTYVFFNVLVDGPSMQPTMYTGDVLLAVRTDEIKRGDIIVIDGEKQNSNGGYDWLIKRAIAFEGETVEIKFGRVYINDKQLAEPYLSNSEVGITLPMEWEKRTIGKGEIFYLGDNRVNSSDSRYSKYDTCKKSQVVGVVREWALDVKWLSSFFFNVGKFFRGKA